MAKAVDEFGSLDIAFANAGVSGGLTGLMDQTGAFWLDLLRINLVGPFLMIKHAGKPMAAHGRGSIICTASVAALRSGAGGSPYSASKAGVISLVQTSAQQLAGTGIRVNAICPGLIETGMTAPMFDRAREKGTEAKLGQLNPLTPRGPAGGDRQSGAVPRLRRRVLRERPGHRGGRGAFPAPTRSRGRGAMS